MKSTIIKILKNVVPLLIGVILIWYSYHRSTPEQIDTTIAYMKQASPWLISLSILFGLLSHFSRAWRWKYIFQPLGYKPRFINSLLTVLSAYFINLGIPRAGEVSRAASISTYENIPFNQSFGTIVAERVIDLLVLFSLIAFVLLFQTDELIKFVFKEDFSFIKLAVVFGLLFLTAAVAFFILKKSKLTVVVKLKNFAQGVWEGFWSLKKMNRKGAFLAHTFFIWGMYVLMFYVVALSIPETAKLPLIAILTAFVVGGLSMSTTNGGIGVYPIAIQQILLLYDVPPESGLAFGWIIWIAQTVLVITTGFLSLLLLPIVNRK